MTRSLPLIFFGNERLSTGYEPIGAPTLQALIDSEYNICAIVTHYTPGVSRSRRGLEIEAIAKKYNIPLLFPAKLREIKHELQAFSAIAGILVAYGKIIPQDIIDIFPRGIINIHPSLLPKYRGPTPIEQTILSGDTTAGVSLMQLAQKMDAGPIFAQKEIPIGQYISKHELTTELLHAGRDLLLRYLPEILSGNQKPIPQDEAGATFTQLLQKDVGNIDWQKTAIQIEREIRAYAIWPKSRTNLYNQPVVITKAHVAQGEETGLTVPCGKGSFVIDELIAPSGRKMDGQSFVRGYKKDSIPLL